jgi:hypothetical protein
MSDVNDPAGRSNDLVQTGKGDADEYGEGSGSSSKSTKADLLAEAKDKGLDVSDSMTKAQIQAALDEHASAESGSGE